MCRKREVSTTTATRSPTREIVTLGEKTSKLIYQLFGFPATGILHILF
jgi:hypothetical protein